MIHENLEEIYAKKIQKQNQEKLKNRSFQSPGLEEEKHRQLMPKLKKYS